jgi:hypothetical protein
MSNIIPSTDFHLTVKDHVPVVTRHLNFKNGDSISFTVSLPNGMKTSLADLHVRSVEEVIAHLQASIMP